MTETERLLTPAQLSDWLQVDRGYIYEHANELGALRLGSGPRARLRFDPDDVRRWLACSSGRGSREAGKPAAEPIPRRRRTRSTGTNVQLLPVRGPIPSSQAVREAS